ncbi:putative F-box protein [Tanacetum coccineum]
MSDVVPFEVQMEIVKRVDDVSSLIRFRSVSKEWKSFIDSRDFIAGYGFRHTQPSRFMLRYLHYQENHKEDDLLDEFGEIIRTGLIWFSELEKYICFVDNDDGFALQHDFPPFVVVPDLIQQLKGDKIVVGMSRGLFCMHGLDINSGRGTIVIWNPSIRKSVGILVPDHVPHTFDFDNYGFGVCPVTWQVKFFYIEL